MHIGDFDVSTVIYGKFTTFRPSTGATYTLAGTPALSVYKDNSTTQSTTGVTLTADFDSVTGLNHFAIDTSADGTFYSAGSFFDIVITTGTVDSVSVTGSVVGRFTLRKNSALKPATAGRALVVDSNGLADANMVKAGPTGSGTAQTARDIGGAVPAAAAGASGGLLISGSNSGTTTLGALTVSGTTTLAALAMTTLTASGAVALQSTLAVTGTTTLTGAVTANNAGNAITGVTAALTGDLTATMKTSVTTAATAATPTAAAVTGAVGSVTGAVGSVTTVSDKTGYALSATGSAALTESYATDGSAATMPQLLYMIWSMLAEKSITTTTLTAKKLDGSTSAMTFTLNDATNPTAITRAT